MTSYSHVTHQRHSPQPLSISTTNTIERFPSLDYTNGTDRLYSVASPQAITPASSLSTNSLWPARRSSQKGWAPGGSYKHKSRRSVGDALGNFRTRRASVSENAQELAEALKAPVSYKLVALCIVWYMTSALTNTSSKSILNTYNKPATLTIVQFAFVSTWCLILSFLASVFPALKRAIPALKNGLRRPSADVLATALPLSVFQLLGHLLSSYATSKIPVSLVHTIKGLSPLFTVFAYRIIFQIRYARATYLSLVPLTFGVILACSTSFSSNILGITAALVAAIVFVTQNIFSKKLFNEASRIDADLAKSRKLDKLNLLCYCSLGAFILTTPVWFLTEGYGIVGDIWKDGAITLFPKNKKAALDHGPLFFEFIFNGLTHFGQNIIAFVLLSMLSPVSYSVASLIKRVWVIIIAIIYFRQPTTPTQAFGIALTAFGLYLYDRNSIDDAAERKAKNDHFRSNQNLLPLQEVNESSQNGHAIRPVAPFFDFRNESNKKEHETNGILQPTSTQFSSSWLPPGTTQATTWGPGDAVGT